MYKKQLRFQKIVCLVCIIAAAVSFVYALGLTTDLYDSLYSTMPNPLDPTETSVEGSVIYYDIQDFNKAFVNYSILLILAACLLFITNTQIRRKYYISNYISVGIYSISTLIVAIWSHIEIAAYKTQYLTTVDFEALLAFAEKRNKVYSDSTFWFDAHYVVAGLMILAVAALIANTVWKVQLMKAENQLIEEGKEAVV